jgi:predicted KAP-like P-loop ATPase
MINWSELIAKFISMLMSWLDASNLRNRVYQLEETNEILRTALEDIQRMDAEGRVGWYAKSVLDRTSERE